MLTDQLHCRALALLSDDFGAVSTRARQFGTPVSGFDSSGDALVWRERVAFKIEGSGWSSGLPSAEVVAHIAVLRLDSPSSGISLLGIVSSFGSLAGAARHWLQQATNLTSIDLSADLDTMANDPMLWSDICGLTVATDDYLLSAAAQPGMNLQWRPQEGSIKSLTLRTQTGLIEINEALDLTLPDQDVGDLSTALADIRNLYAQVNYKPAGIGVGI